MIKTSSLVICFCLTSYSSVAAFTTPTPIRTFKTTTTHHPSRQPFSGAATMRQHSVLNMALKEPPTQEMVNGETKDEVNGEKSKSESTTNGSRTDINADGENDNKEESAIVTDVMDPIIEPIKKEIEDWEHASKVVEVAALGTWLTSISAFIFINNFVGPWPGFMSDVPREVWGLTHAISAMLFGGGIILTTAFEWLVTSNKNKDVLSFYFDKVPFLDAMIVLPALTTSMISGTGLSIAKYDGLGEAPPHVKYTLWCLTAFASWWALTDLSTQGSALKAINEWKANTMSDEGVPKIIEFRKFSNVVSCGFVLALYYIMVVKPGYTG